MPDRMTFEFLDVGMGDGTLVKIGEHGHDEMLWLVDFGEKRSQFKVPYRDALVYLIDTINTNSNARGLAHPTLDMLVITHPDGDHYNKIEELIDSDFSHFPGEQLHITDLRYSGLPGEYSGLIGTLTPLVAGSTLPLASNVHCAVSRTGVLTPTRVIGGIRLYVLSANWPTVNSATNPKSIVQMFELDGRRVILGGDETIATENHILGDVVHVDPTVLRSLALKIGHHGSKGSSSDNWIEAVRPRGIFGSGDFAWSHPYCETICRFLDSGYLQPNFFAADSYYCCGDSGDYYNNATRSIICMNLWFTVLRWRTQRLWDESMGMNDTVGFLTTFGVQWEIAITAGAPTASVVRTEAITPYAAPVDWDCAAIAQEPRPSCALAPPDAAPLLPVLTHPRLDG